MLIRRCSRVRNTNIKESGDRIGGNGKTTVTRSVEAVYKRQTFEYEFSAMPNPMPADWGLADNRCQPKRNGKDDRGFALLNRDPWFDMNAAAAALTADYKMKMSDVSKREVLQQEELAIVGVNRSSDATESDDLTKAELLREFGLFQCADRSCKKELEELGLESINIAYADGPTKPAGIAATSTAVSSSATVTSEGQVANTVSSRSLITPSLPRMTPSQQG